MLDFDYLRELKAFYHRELLDNILPFWLEHGRDRECGGYATCLDRDGSVYDHDKLCMWHAGRMIWTFSFLYDELQQRPGWLDMAACGAEFVQRYGFAPDGRMYYSLTRDGQPLEPPRDVFTELSTVLGFSEYARATGRDAFYEQARAILLRVWDRIRSPGKAFQPFLAATRPVRLFAHSLITLNAVQELRRCQGLSVYEETILNQCLECILTLHRKPERRAVLEAVAWDGAELPGTTGRWINPGHMIEGGTFLVHEGQHRAEDELVQAGIDLIDWGFEWGWDREFGGLFNDVDFEGLPVPTLDALRYDAKLWWQHAEALYGTLLAYCTTEDERFLEAYRQVHAYSFEHFADPEFGEWYALLDRRGNAIHRAKGTARKSAFHIARSFYLCHALAARMTGEPDRLEDVEDLG